mgnify:CR=1 FL=1
MESFNKKLSELERRFNIDQNALKNSNKEIDNYRKIVRENSEWLKNIINLRGWFPRKKLSGKGELYEWLIVQHSDDINFQKSYLSFINKLPKEKERNKNIAYITDRILINENKKQLYGTQFRNKELFPIYNPKKLNNRRKNMNLNPLKIYQNIKNNIHNS